MIGLWIPFIIETLFIDKYINELSEEHIERTILDKRLWEYRTQNVEFHRIQEIMTDRPTIKPTTHGMGHREVTLLINLKYMIFFSRPRISRTTWCQRGQRMESCHRRTVTWLNSGRGRSHLTWGQWPGSTQVEDKVMWPEESDLAQLR